MSECLKCHDTGIVDCPVCNNAGTVNINQQPVLCVTCNGQGQCLCPYCDEGSPRKIRYPEEQ